MPTCVPRRDTRYRISDGCNAFNSALGTFAGLGGRPPGEAQREMVSELSFQGSRGALADVTNSSKPFSLCLKSSRFAQDHAPRMTVIE